VPEDEVDAQECRELHVLLPGSRLSFARRRALVTGSTSGSSLRLRSNHEVDHEHGPGNGHFMVLYPEEVQDHGGGGGDADRHRP
jgi:hypothetical protein